MKRIACLIIGLFGSFCAISSLPQLWRTFREVDISSTYGQTNIIAGIAALLFFVVIGLSGLKGAFRNPKPPAVPPHETTENQPPAP